MYLMENMVMVIFCQNLRICKVSGSIVWCEDASPGAIRGAMTDGLVEVIGVSCKLLLSDGVSMSLVSSNGSIPGLVGRSRPTPTLYAVTMPPKKFVGTIRRFAKPPTDVTYFVLK